MRRLRSNTLFTAALLGVLASSLAAQPQAPEADTDAERGGWMGLYIRTVDRDDIEALDLDQDVQGVVVSGIDDEGPAAEAGIEPGDVITEFDGRRVRNRRDFMRQLERRRQGERVELTVIRDAAEKSFDFVLGERPRELERRYAPLGLLGNTRGLARSLSFGGAALGVRTLELENADLAEYFGADAGEGVLVTDVVEDSGAQAAGIQGGDIILSIEDQSVSSIEDLREALSAYEVGDEVEVRLRRQRRDQSVKVELTESTSLAFSRLNVPSRTWVVGDDAGDLRREVRELKRELRRLEREIRRR